MSKYPFNIQFLSDGSYREKRSSTGNLAPVILCGSLISSFKPTSIPNGMALSASLFSSLFSTDEQIRSVFTEDDIVKIQKVFNGELNVGSSMPFEILFHDCPCISPIKEMLFEYFSHRQYNILHYSLIELMLRGDISAIITPNYDECLNLAARELYQNEYKSRLKIITKEIDTPDIVDNPTNTILYLHGCVCDEINELIVTMSDEKSLPKWKINTLSKLLQGRELLIIGYSGLDFEICPVLFNLIKNGSLKRIIYNKYVPFVDKEDNINSQNQIAVASLTYNINNVLSVETMSASKNVFIVGDIIETINQFFGTAIKGLEFDFDSAEFLEKLEQVLAVDPKSRLLWVLRILARMGCAKQGIKLIMAMQILNNPEGFIREIVWIAAAILYRAGQYKDASKLYCVCMRNIDAKGRDDGLLTVQSLAIRNDLFESYRAGGYSAHAIRVFFQIKYNLSLYRKKRNLKEDLVPIFATVYYRELAVYRRFIGAHKFCLKFLKKRVRFLIISGLNLSMQYGERILLHNFAQEFQLLSKCLGEDVCQDIRREVNIDAILSMKESTKGFDEMGTLFEQIIYRRNQYLAASCTNNMTGRINDTSVMPFNREHLEYLSMISYLYGIFPEAYKCLAIAGNDKLCIEGE